ncbi:unnamed protein product [Malus baccata var. baccata]
MLNFWCKRLQLVLPCCRIVCGSATRLRVFQREPIFIGSYASKSSLVAEKDKIREKDRSFTVMYLINPCGLSIDDAVSASKKVHFDSPEGPDSVFNLFKHYGVRDISSLVRRRPRLLLDDAEKTIKPKLEFFKSIGISGANLDRMLGFNSVSLKRNLERSVFNDEELARFLENKQWVEPAKVINNLVPNTSLLRAVGVTETTISYWVVHHLSALLLETEKYKGNVKKVMSLGVPPSFDKFMAAVNSMKLLSETKFAQKIEFYKKRGWTADDFLLAFQKDPYFMAWESSIENISE